MIKAPRRAKFIEDGKSFLCIVMTEPVNDHVVVEQYVCGDRLEKTVHISTIVELGVDRAMERVFQNGLAWGQGPAPKN